MSKVSERFAQIQFSKKFKDDIDSALRNLSSEDSITFDNFMIDTIKSLQSIFEGTKYKSFSKASGSREPASSTSVQTALLLGTEVQTHPGTCTILLTRFGKETPSHSIVLPSPNMVSIGLQGSRKVKFHLLTSEF
ncbi:hypothetical protein BD770DRAFT_430387 [Pilaira anomala]|nr:hypothetical protein BD770DRAFT_430387 [Pilaira anomala]